MFIYKKVSFMKKLSISTIFILGFFFNLFANELEQITNYQVLNKSIINKGISYTILRSFSKNLNKYFLIVDETTLHTKVVNASSLKISEPSIKQTKYKKLLKQYSKEPFTLQNYGLKHINSNYIYLTADLCPSSKYGYEKEFINALISKHKKAVPITFFISGLWIEKHKNEFLELISYQKENKLDITWANHTFTHYYNPKEPLERNFLLSKNKDITNEILELEKLLLTYNITPSILFRFPGLVSNKQTALIVNSFGLIPVGSDTWLAKDEKINKGSIILIHANKNEPKGIEIAKKSLLENNNFSLHNILDNLK